MLKTGRQKYIVYVLVFFISQFVAFYFGFREMEGYSHVASDFESYYLAAKSWEADKNPYIIDTLANLKTDSTGTPFPYLYTPLTAQSVLPLTLFDLKDAALLWGAGLIIAYGLCMFFCGILVMRIGIRLGWISGNVWTRALMFSLCILCGFMVPYFDNLHYGQVNIFILLLLLFYLSLYISIKDSKFGAGMALGLASVIKIVPVFLLLCHLRSKKTFFLGFISGVGIAIACSVLLFGITPWLQFAEALPQFAYGKRVEGLWELSDVYNIALSGKFARIFADDARYILMAGLIAGVLVLAYFIWVSRRIKQSFLNFYLSAGIVTALMILFSPIAYFHHLIWLYPFVLFFALFLIRQPFKFKWAWLSVYAVILFLVFFNFSFKYYKFSFTTGWTFYAINTIGLLFLVGIMIAAFFTTNRKVLVEPHNPQ